MRRAITSSLTLAVLVMGALLMLPARSFATPVFGCTAGTVACNGNLYAVSVSHVGNTYLLELDIELQAGYTGNHWTDVVETVAVKDFASAMSNISLVSAPDGVSNWVLSQGELNANGCNNNPPPGHTRLCAVATDSPYVGAPVTGPGEILSWVFQFDTTTLGTTAHPKYEYEDSAGKKIGDLGSWDIAIQTCAPNEQHCGGTLPAHPLGVPEPQSLALVALALLALAALRVRYKALSS